MVKLGIIVSSIIYKVFREGMAMNINIRAGRVVQKSSISWASKKNRLKDLDKVDEVIRYKVKIVTLTKITIAWSWKNIKCSIKGEFLFWKDKADQVGISLLT